MLTSRGTDGGSENDPSTIRHLWVGGELPPTISRLLVRVPSIPEDDRIKIPMLVGIYVIRRFPATKRIL